MLQKIPMGISSALQFLRLFYLIVFSSVAVYFLQDRVGVCNLSCQVNKRQVKRVEPLVSLKVILSTRGGGLNQR